MAEMLEAHLAVSTVRYPGLDSHPQRDVAKRLMTTGGPCLSFVLAGGLEAGRRFVEAVELAQVAPSLGGPETLVVHPPTMTAATLRAEERAAMGIGEGMIRVSMGLEHVDDLIVDFRQALDRAAAST
jgi:cystathionine beta-lyase/cystathionine gamma-synthase